MTLSKLFDECLVQEANLSAPDTLMSVVREKALKEFLRRLSSQARGSSEICNDIGWRQDTPRMQSTVILQSIEGWVSNLWDGSSSPQRVVEGVNKGVAELRKLHDGWLKEIW